jgi:phosphatidylinositol alpha-1,6-mannosyltransferase
MNEALKSILLLTEIFPPTVGGSGRYFYELYSRLPPGVVTVVAPEHLDAAQFNPPSSIDLVRIPMTIGDRGLRTWQGLKFYLGVARRLKAIIRERNISIVHCGRNLPEGFVGYLLKLMTGTPYLFYTHGEDIGVCYHSRELAWMTRRVMSGSAGAIANSNNTLRLLKEQWHFPGNKAYVIQPGMDASRFAIADKDMSLRHRLGWANRKVILTVGRLQRRKGHDMLIRALSAIRAVHPTVLYAIIGTGQDESYLRELANTEGVAEAVQFLGSVTDTEMTVTYQQCDLFALPNREIQGDIEGFGMVLLEAQACGKPVLAGNSGGTAETMNPGETGVVVDCTAPQPLADTIIELLADPDRLQAMGSAARPWVESQFDWPQRASVAQAVWGKVQ